MQPSLEEMTGASNIGSRAETVQVSNIGATREWYTETIYSCNRDKTLWPYPSRYTVPLSRNYKRVLEVELLNAEFPRSTYVIEARNPELNSEGNNSFRFGEGYIIDDGHFYCGVTNDRLKICEYTPSSNSTHSVTFPHTLSFVSSIQVLSSSKVQIHTRKPHNLTTKFTPTVWLIDGDSEINGKYEVKKIIDAHSFIACTSNVLENNNELCEMPYLYVPRVESPQQLAEMVQEYLNIRATPPVKNQYCVKFNACTGRFSFDRAEGVYYFDVLAGEDERSIFPTMGFAGVDYIYGSWSNQNIQQTVLPSDMLENQVRPLIVSQTVGESALVCVPEGNYLPTTLATTLTQEMQRPLVYSDENDILTVQLLAQTITITVPPGMYTPDGLAETIADAITAQYHLIGGNEKFCGLYDRLHGTYSFESTQGANFGLLFSQSTIGPILGFDSVDLVGGGFYTSMRSVFVPMIHGRYTSAIYNVSAQLDQFNFRFLKTGQFQAPLVEVQNLKDHKLLISTWTPKLGGAAHGFQPGDIICIEGKQDPQQNVGGFHLVEKVVNAFSFEIRGHVEKEGPLDHPHVCSHWFEPFFLQFPGVPDSISQVVGFPRGVAGCVDYVGPDQWNFIRRCDLFLNILNISDGEYRRIHKTHDSGAQSKYSYETLTSFVRIPFAVQADF